MGRAAPLDRELVFTDASLAVAAARQRGVGLDAMAEAGRILRGYPDSGVTEVELAQAIAQLIEATDPLSGTFAFDTQACDQDPASLRHPREGTGGE